MLTLLKCLWYNQRIILYPYGFAFLWDGPRRVAIPYVRYEDVELITKDKVKLRCYLIPQHSQKPLRGSVIIFHGNAMNHGDIVEPHAVFFSAIGFSVLTVEYRGYGLSDGTPSESGLCLDAQAGFDYIANHPELSKHPKVIFGQSLGGAVAIDVTSRNVDKISALIIENTFCSIPHMVRKWPMGWFLSLFVTQKWPSSSKMAELPTTLPILMLSGLRDTVIPSSEMQELWDIAQQRKTRKKVRWFGFWKNQTRMVDQDDVRLPENDVFKVFCKGGHNDTCMQRNYWETVTAFLDKVVPSNLEAHT